MRALRSHGSHNRRATIPGRRKVTHRERPSPHATRRAGMRALRSHGSHNRRATIPGRRKVTHRERPLPQATRRAGMRALRCLGPHIGRATVHGRRIVTGRSTDNLQTSTPYPHPQPNSFSKRLAIHLSLYNSGQTTDIWDESVPVNTPYETDPRLHSRHASRVRAF